VTETTTTTGNFTVETIAPDGLTHVVRIVDTIGEAMEAARVAALTSKVVGAEDRGFTVGVRSRDTAAWTFTGTFDAVLAEVNAMTPLSPAEAKIRAGYGEHDTPMKPARSAYTENNAGDIAYGRAVARWATYVFLTEPSPETAVDVLKAGSL